jgi:hypothetical protein
MQRLYKKYQGVIAEQEEWRAIQGEIEDLTGPSPLNRLLSAAALYTLRETEARVKLFVLLIKMEKVRRLRHQTGTRDGFRNPALTSLMRRRCFLPRNVQQMQESARLQLRPKQIDSERLQLGPKQIDSMRSLKLKLYARRPFNPK